MEDITTPREKILKKVRAGLLNKFAAQFPDVEMESDLFTYADPDKAVAFGKAFTHSGGGFVYCHNTFDFQENLMVWMDKRNVRQFLVTDPDLRKEMDNLGLSVKEELNDDGGACLVKAEAIIARNGSIVLSSAGTGRHLLTASPVLVVLAQLSRLCDDTKQALVLLRNRYGDKLPSLISLLHGSAAGNGERNDGRELVLFVINDRV